MVVAEQSALGYAFILINRQGNVVKKRSYMGPEAVDNFLASLSQFWQDINKAVLVCPIQMVNEDEARFQNQQQCKLCFHPFDDKHPAHCHHDLGLAQHNYLGACCSRCNLQCHNMRHYVITLAHNMSFDVTTILKEFNYPESKVSILSKSSTQLFRVRMGDLEFQDTLSI